jgi:outer membrane receptor protein involved in Fe transport
LELSASWNPWRGFTISPDFTYTDARLTQTLPPPTTVVTPLAGTAGDKLPFTAEYAGNLSVQQNFSVSADVSAYVGADYSYVGSRPAAFLTNSPLALGPRFNFPGYGLLELDAGVDWSESWRLNFYARNLGNVQGVVSATNRGGTAQPSAYFTQPRTIGVDVQYNFKHR